MINRLKALEGRSNGRGMPRIGSIAVLCTGMLLVGASEARSQTKGTDTVTITDPAISGKLYDVLQNVGVPSQHFLYMIVVRDNGRSLLVSDKQWSDFKASESPVEGWNQIDYFMGWKDWLATLEDEEGILPAMSTAKVCKPCDGTICCGAVSQ
jgi:hypothetical protein